MNDAEKEAALEWLARAVSPMPIMSIGGARQRDEEDRRCRATLKGMLAEPRMPKESTPEIREAVAAAWAVAPHNIESDRLWDRLYIAALYAHLTRKPATKTVEVWRVEYSCREFEPLEWKPQTSTYPNTPEGIRARDSWIESFKGDKRVACIHVTGPHTQEVPA